MRTPFRGALAALALTVAAPTTAQTALAPSFTYQGQLRLAGTPVNDTADFRFTLWDAATGGNQVGSEIAADAVQVVNGVFTTELDFGAGSFDDTARWLQIAVRSPAGSGVFTTLGGRQALTAAPFSVVSLNNWGLAGNSGTDSATDFIGTTDEEPLEFRVNNERALRLGLPGTQDGTLMGGNVVGGSPANSVAPGNFGATVFGGSISAPNQIFAGRATTIAGGFNNRIEGGSASTIGGGATNTIDQTGPATDVASTIGGGVFNLTDGNAVTISGGDRNSARGGHSTIAGGFDNSTRGAFASVPGGAQNLAGGDYSFAAGRLAIARSPLQVGDADGDQGTFVWSDSTGTVFQSTGPDQFLVRASGGVGIGTNNPQHALDVNGAIRSSQGGVVFPDGTVQASAAAGAGLKYITTTRGRERPASIASPPDAFCPPGWSVVTSWTYTTFADSSGVSGASDLNDWRETLCSCDCP